MTQVAVDQQIHTQEQCPKSEEIILVHVAVVVNSKNVVVHNNEFLKVKDKCKLI